MTLNAVDRSGIYDPNTPIETRRLYSTVFSHFPWQSKSLVFEPEPFKKYAHSVPGYERFILCLHDFETNLFKAGSGLTSYDLLRLLGVRFQIQAPEDTLVIATSSKHDDPWTTTEFHDVASVVTAYRLCEWLLLRANLVQRVPSPSPVVEMSFPQSKTKLQESLYGWQKIQDWPQVLFDFKKAVSKLTPEDKTVETSNNGNSFMALLRLVSKSNAKNAYNAIENNFLHAALHLNVMRNVAFRKDQVPDLPKDFQKSTYPIFNDINSAGDECAESPNKDAGPEVIWNELQAAFALDTSGVLMLRAALQLALLISPIYLLLAFQIVKKSFHRRTVLEYAAKLGPNKPQLLVKVEEQILDAVDGISMGCMTPRSILQTLSQSLPWDELETARADPHLCRWFDNRTKGLSTRVPLCTSSSGDGMLDLVDAQSRPPDFGDGNFHQLSLSGEHLPTEIVSSSRGLDMGLPSLTAAAIDVGYSIFLQETESQHGGSSLSLLDYTANDARQSSPSHTAPQVAAHATDQATLKSSDQAATLWFSEDQSMKTFETEGDDNGSDSDLSSVTLSSDEDGASSGPSPLSVEDPSTISSVTPTSESRSKPSLNKPSKQKPNKRVPKPALPLPKDKTSKAKAKARGPLQQKSDQKPAVKPGRDLKRRNPFFSVADPSLAHAGTRDRPIDVDRYISIFEPPVDKEYVKAEGITLANTPPPKRHQCAKTFQIFAGNGQSISFRLEAHHDIYNVRFAEFMEKAQNFYVNGKPRFLTACADSLFSVFTYRSFKKMPESKKQEILAKRCVVVRNWPHDSQLNFDAKGLSKLAGTLGSRTSLHDTSLPIDPNVCLSTVVNGRVSDLLDNATPTGKILNGLDFPMFKGELADEEYATDVVAWSATCRHPNIESGVRFPIDHTLWGLAGLKYCFTFIHVDADGFLTKNLVGCGGKAWGVLGESRHKNAAMPPLKLSSVHFFVDSSFGTTSINPEAQFEVEVILLQRGDMLFMPPGTPHFVITTDHAICLGGHFYTTNAMQQTLQSIVHTFSLDDYLTNISHPPSRSLLRRIMLFYYEGLIKRESSSYSSLDVHLPDILGIEGVLNLLSTCILVAMGNVLDFRTYRAPTQKYDINVKPNKDERLLVEDFDVNAIPFNERQAICFARGVALHVMSWLRSCCSIESENGGVFGDLPSFFLVQIASSILTYHDLVYRAGLKGIPGCTKKLLTSQISNMIECDSHLTAMWARRADIPSDSLEFAKKSEFTVKWIEGWESTWQPLDIDFFELGMTELDKKYFYTQQERRKSENDSFIPRLKALIEPEEGERSAKRLRRF